MRDEFIKLKEYEEELTASKRNRVVMRSDRLMAIRDNLEWCDKMINIAPFEAYYLFLIAHHWEKCWQLWLKYKPMTETAEIPKLVLKTKNRPDSQTIKENKIKALTRVDRPSNSPYNQQKSWEEVITPDDRKYLKSLRIASDDTINNAKQ